MRVAAAIVIVLGTTGCRQVLGIDPAGVRGDAASGSDAGDDAPLEDASTEPDMMIDAPLGAWTNIAVAPGFLASDSDPTLTSDMLEIYFTRGGGEIFFAKRATVATAWSAPTITPFMMGGNSDQVPELTGDGLVLQFASDRGPGAQMDIYYVSRLSRTSQWSGPTPLTSVNDTGANELTGSANTSGSHLTLSSTRNGNGTGIDLYEAFRPGALGTPYDAPVRIPLSTTADDGAPFLTNDGLTLYYAASLPGQGASRDLYVATRASDTVPFTSGTPIDELNTASNDSDPWVSPDGREIYFSSNRDGATRIWHASRP